MARLEAERDQHRREIDRHARQEVKIARMERKLDRLCLSVESLVSARQRQREQWQWVLKLALFVGLTIGAEMASGAWGRVLSALAQRFA